MKSNIRTLEKNFTVNKNSIELYIEVSVDGKKIIDRKSDSLVSNFLKTIYAQMGGHIPIENVSFVNQSAVGGNNGSATITNINASGTPVVITASGSLTNSGHAQISGVEVISGDDINGVWEVTNTGGNNYELIGSSGGGSYGTEGAFAQTVYPDNEDFLPGNNTPSNPSIVVSTSTGDINIDSWNVDGQIQMRNSSGGVYPEKTLQAGNLTISNPFVDQDSSLFTISQTFFNGTENTINVRKAGLFGQVGKWSGSGPDGQAMLLAEDYITSDLAPTETLSVNYKIVNSTTPDGGILSQFTRLYHSLLSGKRSSLAIPQIDGTLFNSYPSTVGSTNYNYPFVATSVPGYNKVPIGVYRQGYNSIPEGWKTGPVLGNAVRSVENTDHTLLDASDEDSTIQHGSGAGELYFYGSIVHDWEEDPVTGVAQFTISRFFENRSGGTVDVRQIGLNSTFYSWVNSQMEAYTFCLSSNTLASNETFADGEYGLVNITLSVEV